MQTLSLIVGTAPVDQLAAVPKLPLVGAPAVTGVGPIQVSVQVGWAEAARSIQVVNATPTGTAMTSPSPTMLALLTRLRITVPSLTSPARLLVGVLPSLR